MRCARSGVGCGRFRGGISPRVVIRRIFSHCSMFLPAPTSAADRFEKVRLPDRRSSLWQREQYLSSTVVAISARATSGSRIAPMLNASASGAEHSRAAADAEGLHFDTAPEVARSVHKRRPRVQRSAERHRIARSLERIMGFRRGGVSTEPRSRRPLDVCTRCMGHGERTRDVHNVRSRCTQSVRARAAETPAALRAETGPTRCLVR